MDKNSGIILKAQHGDKVAKEKVVELNMGFIIKCVNQYSKYGFDFEDLKMEGIIGIFNALKKYDASSDVKFLTYAVPFIEGRILRTIREKSDIIRIPTTAVNRISNFINKRNEMIEATPGISRTDIASKLGISLKKYNELEKFENMEYISFDMEVKNDSNASVGDYIPYEETGFNDSENKIILEKAMEVLTDKEKVILRKHYIEDKKFKDMSRELNISSQRLQQICKSALEKIKKYLDR